MTRATTGLRRAGMLTMLAALMLPVSSVPPAAMADDAITRQDYADAFHLKDLHDKGYTGKGVTIAYIEASPDMSVPELQGANIETRSPCDMSFVPEGHAHSTTVASILANKDWGWAPEATIINYTAPTVDDKLAYPNMCDGKLPSIEDQINRALNDGADIISISMADSGRDKIGAPAFTRAALLGVPIVAGSDNTGNEAYSSSIGLANTVAAVGSTNLQGTRSEFSSYGDYLTIMAPGEGITMRQADDSGKLTSITKQGQGTSLSTPMVAGLLALGKQRWPKATGNQLLRSLIDTATNDGKGWTPEYGWGLISPAKFLNNDPTSLEDTNPLWNKVPGAKPDQQSVADYKDGLADPSELTTDDTYVYRGVDETLVRSYPDKSEFGTSPRYRK